jgi:Lrp/AsnC family transcriptional regulator, leucine-responsive regulatory protein
MAIKLDKTDLKILRILQNNGKITNIQLSNDIGLSPAPTLERVRKLENSGIIKSYHAVVNAAKLGVNITTFMQVTLSYHKANAIQSFKNEVDAIDEIVECYHVTGQGDFLLKVVTQDIHTYERLILDKITNIEGIGQIQTIMVLSCFKDSKTLPMDYQ